jgi:hypothetical protein
VEGPLGGLARGSAKLGRVAVHGENSNSRYITSKSVLLVAQKSGKVETCRHLRSQWFGSLDGLTSVRLIEKTKLLDRRKRRVDWLCLTVSNC